MLHPTKNDRIDHSVQQEWKRAKLELLRYVPAFLTEAQAQFKVADLPPVTLSPVHRTLQDIYSDLASRLPPGKVDPFITQHAQGVQDFFDQVSRSTTLLIKKQGLLSTAAHLAKELGSASTLEIFDKALQELTIFADKARLKVCNMKAIENPEAVIRAKAEALLESQQRDLESHWEKNEDPDCVWLIIDVYSKPHIWPEPDKSKDFIGRNLLWTPLDHYLKEVSLTYRGLRVIVDDELHRVELSVKFGNSLECMSGDALTGAKEVDLPILLVNAASENVKQRFKHLIVGEIIDWMEEEAKRPGLIPPATTERRVWFRDLPLDGHDSADILFDATHAVVTMADTTADECQKVTKAIKRYAVISLIIQAAHMGEMIDQCMQHGEGRELVEMIFKELGKRVEIYLREAFRQKYPQLLSKGSPDEYQIWSWKEALQTRSLVESTLNFAHWERLTAAPVVFTIETIKRILPIALHPVVSDVQRVMIQSYRSFNKRVPRTDFSFECKTPVPWSSVQALPSPAFSTLHKACGPDESFPDQGPCQLQSTDPPKEPHPTIPLQHNIRIIPTPLTKNTLPLSLDGQETSSKKRRHEVEALGDESTTLDAATTRAWKKIQNNRMRRGARPNWMLRTTVATSDNNQSPLRSHSDMYNKSTQPCTGTHQPSENATQENRELNAAPMVWESPKSMVPSAAAFLAPSVTIPTPTRLTPLNLTPARPTPLASMTTMSQATIPTPLALEFRASQPSMSAQRAPLSQSTQPAWSPASLTYVYRPPVRSDWTQIDPNAAPMESFVDDDFDFEMLDGKPDEVKLNFELDDNWDFDLESDQSTSTDNALELSQDRSDHQAAEFVEETRASWLKPMIHSRITCTPAPGGQSKLMFVPLQRSEIPSPRRL